MALFESYDRRINQITPVLEKYGMKTLDDALAVCEAKKLDVAALVRSIQPICFDNACWAYTLGAAIAIKKGQKVAAEIAATLGEGLQAFCIPGSVAADRKVGLGHGNLAAMLLSDSTSCFAFVAGHESFAAAEGAIGIARSANRVRQAPLRVILNGLGKDAAQIISRINGFTYVQTSFDYGSGELSSGPRKGLLRRRARQGPLLRGRRRSRGRGHPPSGGGGHLHHRQLHQPHPLPAPGGRHLQEGAVGPGAEILLGRLRRRYRPHPASRIIWAPVPPPTA